MSSTDPYTVSSCRCLQWLLASILLAGSVAGAVAVDPIPAPKSVSGPVSYAAAVERVSPATVLILNLVHLSDREQIEYKKLPTGLRERLISAHEVFELSGEVYRPLSTGSGVIIDAAGYCV